MKRLAVLIIAVFLVVACGGCERAENAVDLYKKVKDDARQKAQQAQDEAQKIVKEKAKNALSPKDADEEEKKNEEKD